MIGVKVTNLAAAFEKIDRWLADTEHLLERVAVGLIYQGLDIATSRSPQYSGDFVANWKLSVGKMDTSFESGVFPAKTYPVPEGETPFQRGDNPAILHAIRLSAGATSNFRWGQKLWLSNSAKHDDMLEDTYAWKIEDNLIRFRPVNFGGEGPLKQVREHIATNYSRIGKHNIRSLL